MLSRTLPAAVSILDMPWTGDLGSGGVLRDHQNFPDSLSAHETYPALYKPFTNITSTQSAQNSIGNVRVSRRHTVRCLIHGNVRLAYLGFYLFLVPTSTSSSHVYWIVVFFMHLWGCTCGMGVRHQYSEWDGWYASASLQVNRIKSSRENGTDGYPRRQREICHHDDI